MEDHDSDEREGTKCDETKQGMDGVSYGEMQSRGSDGSDAAEEAAAGAILQRMELVRCEMEESMDRLRKKIECVQLLEQELCNISRDTSSEGSNELMVSQCIERLHGAKEDVERVELEVEQQQTLFVALLTAHDQVRHNRALRDGLECKQEAQVNAAGPEGQVGTRVLLSTADTTRTMEDIVSDAFECGVQHIPSTQEGFALGSDSASDGVAEGHAEAASGQVEGSTGGDANGQQHESAGLLGGSAEGLDHVSNSMLSPATTKGQSHASRVVTRARSPISKFVAMSPRIDQAKRKMQAMACAAEASVGAHLSIRSRLAEGPWTWSMARERRTPYGSATPSPVVGSVGPKRGRMLSQEWELAQTVEDDASKIHARMMQLLAFVPRALHWHVLKHKKNYCPEMYRKSTEAAILIADVSGFTRLTETASKLGVSGFEKVSRHLNAYFSSLIEICIRHGGDVIKFAGDALIVMFRAHYIEHSPTLLVATCRAVQCALDMQEKQMLYSSEEGFFLSLHIGIGAGTVIQLHVGGVQSQWEFLVAGDPLRQLQSAVDAGTAGDVIVSPEALAASGGALKCTKTASDDYLVHSIGSGVGVEPADRLAVDPCFEGFLRAYIPKGVLQRVDAGQHGWLGEFRTVSVLFVKLDGVAFEGNASRDRSGVHHELLHSAFCAIQRVIFRFEGTIRQLLVDDKGTVVIAVFGVPPFSHEDDPVRACRSALLVRQSLYKLGCYASIGITTGDVYCGAVGCSLRREYAVLGDVVNLSARLMGVAKDCGILCDRTTYEAIRLRFVCQKLDSVQLKGKRDPVQIYRPHHYLPPNESAKVPVVTQLARDSSFLFYGNEVAACVVKRKILLFSSGVRHLDIGSASIAETHSSARTQTNGSPSRMRSPREAVYPSGGALYVEGPRGFGKTYILGFAQHVAMQYDVDTMAMDACAHLHEPLGVWRSLVLQLLECESLSREDQEKKILSALSSESPSSLSMLAVINEPFVMSFAGSKKRAIRNATNQQVAEMRQQIIGDLITSAFRKKPFLLLIDNVHTLAGEDWLMLEYMSLYLPFLPVIATSMPASPAHVLSSYSLASESAPRGRVQLTCMRPKNVERFLLEAFEQEALEQGVAESIFEQSGGIPILVTMFVAALLERQREAGVVQNLDNELTVSLPKNISAIIQSMIDELHPTSQLVLKVCAVIANMWRHFSLGNIVKVFPLDVPLQELEDVLDELIHIHLLDTASRRLVVRKYEDNVPSITEGRTSTLVSPSRSSGEDEEEEELFFFASSAIQEVCFSLLLSEQRRVLEERLVRISTQ